MELNVRQNIPSRNLYNNTTFWQKEIINNNNLWEGYFDKNEITTNSKIIYTGILDLNKNILKCGWAVYPDTYSVLGFLQYVYLPTAFFIWFDRKSDNFYIPFSNLDSIIHEKIKFNNSTSNADSINSMKKSYNFLSTLWNANVDTISLKLHNFCSTFNSTWDNNPNQKLYIKIFDSPRDTFNFVKDSIIYDTKDFVEEDISATLEAFKFACDNAIKEPLLNKRFIDILNTNVPILF